MNKKEPNNSSKNSLPIERGRPAKLKPRNPLATHPLMKKSHVHDKPKKTKRAEDKRALRKRLLDD